MWTFPTSTMVSLNGGVSYERGFIGFSSPSSTIQWEDDLQSIHFADITDGFFFIRGRFQSYVSWLTRSY